MNARRSGNAPHVFAVADASFQQMLLYGQPQVQQLLSVPYAMALLRYDTIRWTILTCAQKLTSSQLSLPHGTKQKRLMKKLKQT